jgi:hypothetical protein
MKPYSCPRQRWALLGILVSLVLLCASAAAAQVPSIEGTYQLLSRTLPDGTVLKPPEIMGLFTYTKRHRTVNIVRQDATGKVSSSANVSTYTLTATEYSETRLFSIVNDQIGGKDIVYTFASETRSAPVTVEGGRFQFKNPLGTRSLVFEGHKVTATAEGTMDVWEKVE